MVFIDPLMNIKEQCVTFLGGDASPKDARGVVAI
jgi:hypothetical protein